MNYTTIVPTSVSSGHVMLRLTWCRSAKGSENLARKRQDIRGQPLGEFKHICRIYISIYIYVCVCTIVVHTSKYNYKYYNRHI